VTLEKLNSDSWAAFHIRFLRWIKSFAQIDERLFGRNWSRQA